MGNYMETCIQRKEETPQQQQQQQQQEKEEEEEQKQGQQEKQESSDGFSKESSRMRVKLVLTKDELQWLLVQLKKDEGRRKLEEILGEIEKSRLRGENVARWKPCLESIMESPEVHHLIMDR